MAFVHAKNTVIKVSGTDISAYTNTSNFEKNSDKHDLTVYGKDAHVFGGGLLNGAMGFGGIYDSTASTGPRALLEPLVGTNVTVIRRPEGTGAGKPQDSFDALIEKYTESSPVADYIQWACEVQPSDTMTSTAQ